MNQKIFFRISALILILSILVSGISLIPDTDKIPGFDWATFDRTSSVGPLDYTLKADFDAVGFEYSLGTSSSSSGGGIIGGIGGGIGSNVSREEKWKAYPKVRGEVLENLGIIYDSYKEKSYIYELLFRTPPDPNITYGGSGSPSAYLNVSMKADLVPYWMEGGSRPIDVRVTFLGTDLEDQVGAEEKERFSITLSRIVIKARSGYDLDTGEYEGPDLMVEEKKLSVSFKDKGDDYHTSIDVKFPEGEPAAGFIIEIDATMNDYWDRGERSPLSGSANPINIRPVARMKIFQALGIPLAMPLILISILVGMVAVILILIKGRSFWGIILPSAILSTAGPVWYLLGMNAAVDLLNERLSGAQEGLSLGLGFYLSVAGSILAITAFILSIVILIISNRSKREETDPQTSQGKVTGPSVPTFKKLEEDGPITSNPSFKRVEDSPFGSDDPTSRSGNGTGGQIMSNYTNKGPGQVRIVPPRPPVSPLS